MTDRADEEPIPMVPSSGAPEPEPTGFEPPEPPPRAVHRRRWTSPRSPFR